MSDTLEAGAGGAGFRGSLNERIPAQAAIVAFLRTQSGTDRRSKVARMLGRSQLTAQAAELYADALGELAVGESLERLDDSWAVLHGVPIGGADADVDHLVIGPGGVFAVSARNYSNQSVWVARGADVAPTGRRNHIRNSEFEIGRVEQLLGAAVGSPVHTTGVIVVVDPRSVPTATPPRDVVVVSEARLLRWFADRPTVLAPTEVARLVSAAASPATWPADPKPQPDLDRLRERFTGVRQDIRLAATVRRLWFIGLTSVLLGVVALAAWGVMVLAVSGPGDGI